MKDSNLVNPSNTQESENLRNLPERLKQALEHFAYIYKIKNSIHREYELLEAAKLCDLPIESFRQMFKDYCRQKQQAKWLKSPLTSFFWRIELGLEWLNQGLSQMNLFQVLEYMSKISILVGLIVFMIEIPKRAEQRTAEQKRTNYESWRIILASEDKAPSGGRIDALQDLNEQHIPLSNINVAGALISKIKLPKAQLDGANMNNTRLNSANLEEAIFINSKLQKAWLINANLKKANLFKADLSNALLNEADLTGAVLVQANLVKADLRKAILNNANLKGADLDQANLSEANGLTITQLKKAKNWQAAHYDYRIREQLGLPSVK